MDLRNIEGQERDGLNSFHVMTGIWFLSRPLANNLYFRPILASTASFREPFYIPLANKYREFIALLRSKESTINLPLTNAIASVAHRMADRGVRNLEGNLS
jgi:hypothetical protein